MELDAIRRRCCWWWCCRCVIPGALRIDLAIEVLLLLVEVVVAVGVGRTKERPARMVE